MMTDTHRALPVVWVPPKKRPQLNGWPLEMELLLAEVWATGEPFSYIRDRLRWAWHRDLTRNACIGKAYRMGLSRIPTPPPYAPADIDAILPKHGHCSWPEGHPGDPGYHCCGARALTGKPYCAAHAAKAYVKPKEERRAAA